MQVFNYFVQAGNSARVMERWRDHARKAYAAGAAERPGEVTADEMASPGDVILP